MAVVIFRFQVSGVPPEADQKSEDRRQMTEDRQQNSEVGMRKSEKGKVREVEDR